MILGGDFNIPIDLDGSLTDLFDCTRKGHGLFLTNRELTRGRSCLDTIATSFHSRDYSVEVGDPVVADHCPLIIKLSFELVSVNHNITAWCANYTRSARFIREESLPLFREALVGTDWIHFVNLSLVHPEQAFMEFSIFSGGCLMSFFLLGCYIALKHAVGLGVIPGLGILLIWQI